MRLNHSVENVELKNENHTNVGGVDIIFELVECRKVF